MRTYVPKAAHVGGSLIDILLRIKSNMVIVNMFFARKHALTYIHNMHIMETNFWVGGADLCARKQGLGRHSESITASYSKTLFSLNVLPNQNQPIFGYFYMCIQCNPNFAAEPRRGPFDS